MKRILPLFFTLIFMGWEHSAAQKINWQPGWIVSTDEQSTAVTLYAKEQGRLLHFRENKLYYFSTDGKQAGEPIIIRKDNGDLQFPRISPSGKNISFYQQADEILKDGAMKLFNTDSNRIVGSYRVPNGADLLRVRFAADSIMDYFTEWTEINTFFRWNLQQGYVNSFKFFKDSSHTGIYDLVHRDARFYMTGRKDDTLFITIFETAGMKEISTRKILLPAKNSIIKAEYSSGFPYLIVTDPQKDSTILFGFGNDHIEQLQSFKGVFDIYAAMGDPTTCKAIIKSTSGEYFILDAKQDRLQPLAFLPNNDNKIFDIDIAKNWLLVSHATNGAISAYDISSQQLQWQQTPSPAITFKTGELSLKNEDAFYKVMIKQGGSSIFNWRYDKEKDQLYIIRDDAKLVTIDASSECALKTEIFNDENFRSSRSRLLPGSRYIFFQQEAWAKDETNTRVNVLGETEKFEDADKYRKIYPYRTKVYDREAGKIVFNFLSSTQADIQVVNDSLLAWNSDTYSDDHNFVFVYNLNTRSYQQIHPFKGRRIYQFKMAMIQDKLYAIGRDEHQRLILLNEAGKLLSVIKDATDNANVEDIVFIPGGPFLFYNRSYNKKGNKVYKIWNDSLIAVRDIIPESDIVGISSTDKKVWLAMKYNKLIGTTSHELVDIREMVSGNLISRDSVTNLDIVDINNYQLFPEDQYFLTRSDYVISWRDTRNGYEFRSFGRDDPAIVSLSYSPEGRYLAAANPYGKVMLWDLGTGKETRSLQVDKGGYITKLAFSGDGKYLAAASGDIWETATGKNIVSVTDKGIWKVNSIDFSKDGKRIISGGTCVISWDTSDGSKLFYQQHPRKSDMDTAGFCFNPNGCVKDDYPLVVTSTALHPNSRDFVTGNINGGLVKWNTEDDSLRGVKILYAGIAANDNTISDLAYTRDGKNIIAIQKNCIYRINADGLEVIDSLLLQPGEEVLHIDMSYNTDEFGCISSLRKEHIVQIRNINGLKVSREFKVSGASFNKISFSPNKKHAATSSSDGLCTIWDIATGTPVMYLNNIGDYGNIMVTPDNYYMASKSALDGVSFLKNGNFYSFDQFDIYLNRPDIVLQRLGYASPELLNFYNNAYRKRLKKTIGSLNDSTINENIPGIQLLNKKNIQPVTKYGWAFLQLEINDSAAQKGRLDIFINGNLVKQHQFVSTGSRFSWSDSVQLSVALNNIEAVYQSAAGLVSRKEKLVINYSPAQPLPSKTWFVGIGVSNYANKTLDLKYPVKDVKDLAAAFKKKYPAAIVDTLLNEKATRENIVALHEKLMKTGINDKVIISFNGHGMLSDSLDWYFATYDVDAAKPERRGLSYFMMESILTGIPARQKLLLLDACHSGEVDKESDITFANKETALQTNVTETNSTARGNIVISKSKAGLQTSFEMMQDLFANLNNSNGTTVLSAAGGREYALESDEWKNGVFTYSILKALKDENTDTNKNKKISVKELKQSVFEAVRQLTGGRQKPTSRLETLDDWNIW